MKYLLLLLFAPLANAFTLPPGVDNIEIRKIERYEVKPNYRAKDLSRPVYEVTIDGKKKTKKRAQAGVGCFAQYKKNYYYVGAKDVAICHKVRRVFVRFTIQGAKWCFWQKLSILEKLGPRWIAQEAMEHDDTQQFCLP